METIKFSVGDIDYTITGNKIIFVKNCRGEWIENTYTGTGRRGRPYTITTTLTIEKEELPGIYRCTYEADSQPEIGTFTHVYYIGLDPKKVTTKEYAHYLFTTVLTKGTNTIQEFGHTIHDIDYLVSYSGGVNSEKISKLIENMKQAGNYIGTIVSKEDGNFETIIDTQAYIYSQETPEMKRIQRNAVQLEEAARIIREKNRIYEELKRPDISKYKISSLNAAVELLEQQLTSLKQEYDKLDTPQDSEDFSK